MVMAQMDTAWRMWPSTQRDPNQPLVSIFHLRSGTSCSGAWRHPCPPSAPTAWMTTGVCRAPQSQRLSIERSLRAGGLACTSCWPRLCRIERFVWTGRIRVPGRTLTNYSSLGRRLGSVQLFVLVLARMSNEAICQHMGVSNSGDHSW